MANPTPHHLAPDVFTWETVKRALCAGNEGVYCWDLQTNSIAYTDQCLTMMGLSLETEAPNVFTQAEMTIHPEDVHFFNSEVKRYIDRSSSGILKSTPMRVEIRLLNQGTKGWKWVRINGLLNCDENNKPTQLVGVWINISLRKMIDMGAARDRDLFRKLINYLPDNIYFKNRESLFTMANQSTVQKMGVPIPADLIGRSDYDFFDQSMSDLARREELEIMETGRPITSRLHKETWKGKKTTWTTVSKFPLTDAQGRINGIIGISSDVTKLVQAQLRAEQLANSLAMRKKELEDELKLARDIQQALLPTRIPSHHYREDNEIMASANFHHLFMPAAGVAGDCFEVFPVGQSGVGIIICDVMGHDVSAALIAAMLRGFLGQFSSLADTPALLLSALNRKLCKLFQQSKINIFSTACYVYLDLQKSRLTLSSAGHPAPIIIDDAGKAFHPAIPRSPALGLRDNLHFRESEIALKPNMRVMLYTDGLTEASNLAGDELGAVRVMNHLNDIKPHSITEMLEESLVAMSTFTEGLAQNDDICLLGVEFVKPSAEIR